MILDACEGDYKDHVKRDDQCDGEQSFLHLIPPKYEELSVRVASNIELLHQKINKKTHNITNFAHFGTDALDLGGHFDPSTY